MNKKRIFFVIPTVLFPYFALCALAVIFFSTKHPLCEWIMERVFGSNAWSLIGAPCLADCSIDHHLLRQMHLQQLGCRVHGENCYDRQTNSSARLCADLHFGRIVCDHPIHHSLYLWAISA